MADPAAHWNDFFEHATLSDVGLRRSNNQDSFTVVLAGDEKDWLGRGHLFMVADGMGAHAAGELASKLACGGVAHTYHKLRDRSAPEALRQAVVETNAHIHGRGQANSEFQGMGTTTSVMVLLPQGAVIAHVGDSRVYRLRRDRLDQLTFDHSLVWEMMAAGQIPGGAVPSFVPKNIITRSLGPHPVVNVDLEGPFAYEPGDTFLMCSDGLSGPVTDDELGLVLGSLAPAEAAQVLVDLANLRGGPDNITVIVVRIKQAPVLPANMPAMSGGTAAHGGGMESVHPAVWVAIGVCLLAAIGLTLVDQLLPAFVCGLGALVAGAVGILTKPREPEPSEPANAVGPLGKGPHTTRDCTPTADAAKSFAELAGKLREAAEAERWAVNWKRFGELRAQAEAATAGQDFRSAVRHSSLAISFMMNEIRQQKTRKEPPAGAAAIDA